MSFRMTLWKVKDEILNEIRPTRLDFEERLESWIADDATILGLDLLIIGRQVQTEFGGRIDLLGVSREGNLVIVELKKEKTPRDVVAQVIDYAAWVRQLVYREIDAITSKHLGKPLAAAYLNHFGQSVPENINVTHSMIVVSAELDEASHRIIAYLADEHSLNINAVFFNFFQDNGEELLGRAWLMDPTEVQERTDSRRQAPWSGYWFVNIGEGPHRNWDDNIQYGYVGAGQGGWYSRALKRLSIGDKILGYMVGLGYVGYGEVTQEAVMINDFRVEDLDKPILDVDLRAERASENRDNSDLSEWAVGIRWIRTFGRNEAKTFKGIFANQNIVCKLRDENTVSFLKTEFGVSNDEV